MFAIWHNTPALNHRYAWIITISVFSHELYGKTGCHISRELNLIITLLSTEGLGLHPILKQPSDLWAENNLHSIDEAGDTSEKMVTFSHAASLAPLPQPLQKPATAPAHFSNGLQQPESLGPLRQVVSGQGSRGSSLHSSRSTSLHSSRNSSEFNSPLTRSLARIGRPIAQVAQVPDPVSEVRVCLIVAQCSDGHWLCFSLFCAHISILWS